jgi:hypothetical protein
MLTFKIHLLVLFPELIKNYFFYVTYITLIIHTYHSRLIPEGIAGVYYILFLDTNMLLK